MIDIKMFFDTETTGVPKVYGRPVSDVDNYPRLVQLGFIVINGNKVIQEMEHIIKPVGFEIPIGASNVHGITTERAMNEGVSLDLALDEFFCWLDMCTVVAGHNVDFDISVMGAEFWRQRGSNPFDGKKTICTMKSSAHFVGIPRNGGYKYPKLYELWFKLFETPMGVAHTALQDIRNTVTCYNALVERGIMK